MQKATLPEFGQEQESIDWMNNKSQSSSFRNSHIIGNKAHFGENERKEWLKLHSTLNKFKPVSPFSCKDEDYYFPVYYEDLIH